jgi:hypothetical protein
MRKFHRRRSASAYLSQNYFPIAPSTLAKLAVVGGGPPFHKVGHVVLYEQTRLDEYAAERIGPELQTTAEADIPHPLGRGRPKGSLGSRHQAARKSGLRGAQGPETP